MKVYITYGDFRFKKQKEFAIKMAKKYGNFDKIISYFPEDIDELFKKKNKDILTQKRGGGYWLWKPYFIYKTLQELNYGDYLFYSDSGACFLKSVDILIKELEKYNQDIMGYEIGMIESQWTKKELFLYLKMDDVKYSKTNQIMGGFVLCKKTEETMKFFKEYLEVACNEINITDKMIEKINQERDFIEHRHDQSIFSLLYKKYNLIPFKDPTQFGEFPEGTYLKKYSNYEYGKIYIRNLNLNGLKRRDLKFRLNKLEGDYENVLFLYRRKRNPFKELIKYKIRRFFSKFIKINKGM